MLINIHGTKSHRGKRPSRGAGSPDRQHKLIQLRREMQEAVASEAYEKAGQLRDEIQRIEAGEQFPDDLEATPEDFPSSSTGDFTSSETGQLGDSDAPDVEDDN
ncbi:MAG TPA: hypothetical protein DDW52_02335 [Planctomycetaceae bacterium]|nr:hypothetical protein [Planctomycetaceae bacterium]